MTVEPKQNLRTNITYHHKLGGLLYILSRTALNIICYVSPTTYLRAVHLKPHPLYCSESFLDYTLNALVTRVNHKLARVWTSCTVFWYLDTVKKPTTRRDFPSHIFRFHIWLFSLRHDILSSSFD